MKSFLLPLAATAALLAAAPAVHAEKWVYWPVPGGAMAFDADSRHADVASGNTYGDTLIYYFVPRAVGAESFSIMIKRLEFECRGDKYQTLGVAYFDQDGGTLGQADGDPWAPVVANTPSAVFKRVTCTNDRPPTAKETSDRETLIKALKALPPTTELTSKAKPATPSPAPKAGLRPKP